MKKSDVIAYFGGQTKTAEALGITQPSVCNWPDDLPFSVLGRIALLQPEAWAALQSTQPEAGKPPVKP